MFATRNKIFICLLLTPFLLFAQGKVKKSTYTSYILGTEKEYSIYLPSDYADSSVEYPVLYLLHGAWGNHRDWPEKGNIAYLATKSIKEGKALPMIIVMPDASGKNYNYAGMHMGYFNYQDWRYQDFFIEEFIPFIEQKYRIKAGKEHRAIAGLSMGGGGSVIFAQKYPDYFGTACSLSGSLTVSRTTPTEDMNLYYLEKARENEPLAFLTNANPETVEKLKTIRWYFDCGDDDYLAPGNLRFYQAMKEKNIPFEFRMNDGEHRWEYWQAGIIPVLQYISIGFGQAERK